VSLSTFLSISKQGGFGFLIYSIDKEVSALIIDTEKLGFVVGGSSHYIYIVHGGCPLPLSYDLIIRDRALKVKWQYAQNLGLDLVHIAQQTSVRKSAIP
jgi:hypothetical protein